MKRKSIFGAVATLILAICFSVAAPVFTANAATECTKIAGYEYTAEYLLEEFGYTAADGADLFDGLTVSYRLEKKRNAAGVLEAVTPLDAETDKDLISQKPGEGERVVKTLTKKTDKVVFMAYGVYGFTVKKEGEADRTFNVATYNYNDLGLEGKEELKYDATQVEAFRAAVVAEAATKTACASDDEKGKFDISKVTVGEQTGLSTVVSSKLFAYEDITPTLYYRVPGSESYSSTSNDSFDIEKVGTYYFYVTFSVPAIGGSLDTTDLVVGEANGLGWYEKNDEGEPIGDVIIPIFSFEVTTADNPVIALNNTKKGYLNLEYTKVSDCFTITSASYKAKYALYYLASAEAVVKNTDETTAEYLARIEAAGGVNVTEDYENFESGSTNFTPEKKGYYYVEIFLKDENNLEAHEVSKAIDVTNEFKTVKKESEFFKNNVTSLVFLSISALCFIAIIVLLCIKPKETVELETKTGKTKNN